MSMKNTRYRGVGMFVSKKKLEFNYLELVNLPKIILYIFL